MKRIFILTMFPEIYTSFINSGVIGKYLRHERGECAISLVPLLLSDFSLKGYKGVDSSSYGGGPGMVIRADVLKNAYSYIQQEFKSKFLTIYLSPKGDLWDRNYAKNLANDFIYNTFSDLLFICGRYEGIDQRFIDKYVDCEISIGQFVLSSGDLALQCILDSMFRFIPGVISEASLKDDSFEDGLLDHPHYTRPELFEGISVPRVLLSGNHKLINKWRIDKKIELTQKYTDINKCKSKI